MQTRQGMKVAKSKGWLRGKQPKLEPAQETHLIEPWHAGNTPASNSLSCSPSPAAPSTAPSSVLASQLARPDRRTSERSGIRR
jgi:hypothetical protein